MATDEADRAAILHDVVALVAGLQVPVSMGMPLGAAQQPWQRLKDRLLSFGWMDTNLGPYVETLTGLLECDREHDYSSDVPFEV